MTSQRYQSSFESDMHQAVAAPHVIDHTWNISRWGLASFVCGGLALVLVLCLELWGMYHDLNLVRETFLESEMGRLRSHAIRTSGRLQDELRSNGKDNDITAVRQSAFLPTHWENVVRKDESRMYAAIVSADGQVVLHTDKSRQGLRLTDAWYDRLVTEAGDNVVETRHEALSNGQSAYDVRAPIQHGDVVIGNYHSGLRSDWIEEQLAIKQRTTRWVWGWILGSTVTVVLAAGVGLHQISRRVTVLHEAMKVARVRRLAELGQLMAGIVHEIRNPLNAMRLNLHVLTRCHERLEQQVPANIERPANMDSARIIDETTHEIERIEGLMRILLGYARPDQPHDEELDVRRELQTTLTFLKPMLERSEVILKAHFPEEVCGIRMDRDRLRQIVLNLINNAKEATGPGGVINVDVSADANWVTLAVADDGPGVSVANQQHIFEPFFSTKELGTGLGLALVKRFTDDVGGTVEYVPNQPTGARFVLKFRRDSDMSAGASHTQRSLVS